MSDVSALVLTTGEPFTQRALDSLSRQTLPPAEVILVENVSPFSSAMNAGITKIKTSFFVQVDADMILDPHCFEVLRNATDHKTGMTVGELRDPMMGQVVGVKLFRTECFTRIAFRDSIANDTDCVAEIERMGLGVTYIEDPSDSGSLPPTLGDHVPDYTPEYTYGKFTIEGARLRYRGSRSGLMWRLGLLERSRHPLANLARIALANGFFNQSNRDLLAPFPADPAAGKLLSILASHTQVETIDLAAVLQIVRHGRPRDVFAALTRIGNQVAAENAGKSACDLLEALSESGRDFHFAIAVVAFGRGLAVPERDGPGRAADQALVGRFVRLGLPHNAGVSTILRAHTASIAQRIGGVGSPLTAW